MLGVLLDAPFNFSPWICLSELSGIMIWASFLWFVFAVASTTSATPPRDCHVAIVGAGIGGVYTAWRLAVDSRAISARHICIFEAKSRPGGRILSVRDVVPAFENYTVDLGAYRYVSPSSYCPPATYINLT